MKEDAKKERRRRRMKKRKGAKVLVKKKEAENQAESCQEGLAARADVQAVEDTRLPETIVLTQRSKQDQKVKSISQENSKTKARVEDDQLIVHL